MAVGENSPNGIGGGGFVGKGHGDDKRCRAREQVKGGAEFGSSMEVGHVRFGCG